MLNLTELTAELKDATEWQETPFPLTDDQYQAMTLRGLRRLFIDTGRALEFDPEKIITDGETGSIYYDQTFYIDEEEYIKLCSRLEFFNKVKTDVNNTFGYVTDALSITNADKPYANLKDTIDGIDNERRILYYKMVRFTIGDPVS